ncbi:MAG: AraC family transcriptional regulator [Lachnospiraceae bacterium]|nr:AraC family transcriptional regulator [Lachnospiraceae bacterium]
MNRDVMGLIVKNDDGSEIVNYDDPAFPSYIYDGWVAPKVTWEKVPHYHEDIEILTVKEGKMAYSVNGKTLLLNAGDTIVVNSNQIHYSMSVDDTVAKYVIFVVHPAILCSSVAVDLQAVRPITENGDLPYFRFRYINQYTEELYRLMMELPDIRNDAFEVTKRFFLIWDIIRKQAAAYGKREEVAADPGMQSFKTMMHFISTSYKGRITLDEIAGSANISRSLCNTLFHRYVGESPISYLSHMRVRKTAEYLRSDRLSLRQIADLTGFTGVSYLSETFKKYFGCSPREYKKQWKNNENNGYEDTAPVKK